MFDYNTSASSSSEARGEKRANLDPNHSHFVLVDNAQLNVYGGEIDFRGRLEKAIVSYEKEGDTTTTITTTTNGFETPIVVLVLEGGPNTLNTGKYSLIQTIKTNKIEIDKKK